MHKCMVKPRVECGMAKRKQKSAASAARKKRRPVLGREAWLNAARQALIEEGTAGVEVNKLAKRLGVSRGGFYWFFETRDQLLDALIVYWAEAGTTLFERILELPTPDGAREFRQLIDLWIEENDYDPKWDGAVRDWARTSQSVMKAVRSVDERRIGIIEQIFRHLGYEANDALIRARITYYHQVGYYAMGVRESRSRRTELLPFYLKALTGREL
jgi:AcrR family transcriptional regulator